MLLKRRRGNIRKEDVEAIAKLVSEKFMNEQEALARLEIKESSWNYWKLREHNKKLYADALSRIRAAKIEKIINKIEAGGEDWQDPATGKWRRGDWRADAWLGERLTPQLRINSEPSKNETNVSLNLILDAGKRVYAIESKPQSSLPLLLEPNHESELEKHINTADENQNAQNASTYDFVADATSSPSAAPSAPKTPGHESPIYMGDSRIPRRRK